MFCPKTNLLLDASALFVDFSTLKKTQEINQVLTRQKIIPLLFSTNKIPQKVSDCHWL